MPGPLAHVYDLALRALDEQERHLVELRSRLAAALATGGVVATLLIRPALRTHDADTIHLIHVVWNARLRVWTRRRRRISVNAMVRSPLRDVPPFDKAPVLPESAFIYFEWGFASVTALWRDWRKRRRERRRLCREQRLALGRR